MSPIIFFKKICYNIFLFIKSKKNFKFPNKEKVLILNKSASDKIRFSILGKVNSEILPHKTEQINLPILIMSLFYIPIYGLSSYRACFISYVSPKIAITFIDTDYQYANDFKYFPSIKLFFIQNGRIGSYRNHLLQNHNYKIDYYAVNSVNVKKYFEQYLDSNFVIAGSMLANNLNKPNLKKVKKIQFISQFRDGNDSFPSINSKKLTKKECLIIPDQFIIKHTCKFAIKKNYDIEVIMFLGNKNEEKYYNDIFLRNNFYNYKLIISKRNSDFLSSYKLISDNSIIVGSDSQLIFELFGLGYRTAIFTLRSFYMKDDSRKFNWPMNDKMLNTGSFWTNIPDENSLSNILNFLSNITNHAWETERKKYNDLMAYSYNNIAIKEVLIKEDIVKDEN
jgi:surface carbohydrate biosynthesis protein